MQDQLIRMETQICNIQEHGPNIPKGVIDTEKLKKFGLPVKDVNRLDELERELIEDLKKNEIVSLYPNLKLFLHMSQSFYSELLIF